MKKVSNEKKFIFHTLRSKRLDLFKALGMARPEPKVKQRINTKENLNLNLTKVNNSYYKNYIKRSLKREIFNIFYKQVLYLNKSKFENTYLHKLSLLVRKVYNKKIVFNIVSLKSFFLNSDIFSESIAIKLRKRKNRLLNVLKKSLAKVKIANLNISRDSTLHSVQQYLKSKNINNDPLNSFFNKLFCVQTFAQSACGTLTKYKANTLFSQGKGIQSVHIEKLVKYLENLVLNSFKFKAITGVRLEAAGRLTRRFTASRAVFKIRYLGNLKNADSSFNGLSTPMARGILRNNIQYSITAHKTKIGAYGLKSWVSSNSFSTTPMRKTFQHNDSFKQKIKNLILNTLVTICITIGLSLLVFLFIKYPIKEWFFELFQNYQIIYILILSVCNLLSLFFINCYFNRKHEFNYYFLRFLISLLITTFVIFNTIDKLEYLNILFIIPEMLKMIFLNQAIPLEGFSEDKPSTLAYNFASKAGEGSAKESNLNISENNNSSGKEDPNFTKKESLKKRLEEQGIDKWDKDKYKSLLKENLKGKHMRDCVPFVSGSPTEKSIDDAHMLWLYLSSRPDDLYVNEYAFFGYNSPYRFIEAFINSKEYKDYSPDGKVKKEHFLGNTSYINDETLRLALKAYSETEKPKFEPYQIYYPRTGS